MAFHNSEQYANSFDNINAALSTSYNMISPLNTSMPNEHHSVQTYGYSNNFYSQSIPNFLYQSSTSTCTQSDDSGYYRAKSTIPRPSSNANDSQCFFRTKAMPSYSNVYPAQLQLPTSKSLSSINLQRTASTSIRITPSLIKPCPNRINDTCQCKSTLRQCKAAQGIWSKCYRICPDVYHELMDNHREIEVTYFDCLYTNLCEYFRYETDSDRVPTKLDISEAIQYFGGFIVNDKEDLMIDRCHFIEFWKWFRGACLIIKDIYRLWDNKFPLQLNLFMTRTQCQNTLQVTPTGTLIMRLSQSQPNGLILCYSEPTMNRNANIRNVLFVRHSPQQYATKGMKEPTDLNTLIRNFAKLKFVYSPSRIYKKSHVF
eukprot:168091_1